MAVDRRRPSPLINVDEQTAAMECLPEALAGRRFYEPKEIGLEREIRERLEKMKKARK
jgi:putative ATPase